jgi:metal-responsive CopG/Arc/MetJ family transcriptional regulator
MAMRLHISLDDELVRTLDGRVGQRQRSTFIATAVQRALDDERRWEDIERAIGALTDSEHAWDADPAAWVDEQRSADHRRSG